MVAWTLTAATKQEPKVSVTYVGDPSGKGAGPDVLESWGFKFPKGEAVEVPQSLAVRLEKSDHWQVGKTGVAVHAPGAPDGKPAADLPDIDSMPVADLRALAEERGLDPTDMTKAELRDVLRAGG